MAEKRPAGEAHWPPAHPQLLRTKLYVPQARPGLVSRPRLSGQLDTILDRKLAVVSAPAGFGKTTILSVWAARCRRNGLPVAWVSLDERDNDPGRFWAHVVAAVAGLTQDAPANAGWPAISPDQAVTDDMVAELVNAVMTAGFGPFVLVLDDFHLITSAAIHGAVGFLVDFLPPQMHLVLASRADPPLQLAQLRARCHLIELRAGDLRFTAEETEVFLNQVMALDLPAESIAELDARAEGWIAGLQLAALSMRDRRDRQAFVRSFTGNHRYIMDYLTEQVLFQLPEDAQRFLLETAILERLSGPLCDAVTERAGSQAILEQLEAANLFLSPLDDQRNWYRCHPLFASLLRNQLEKSGSDVKILHRRAAAWFQENGMLHEAIGHGLEGRDFRVASRLIGELARNHDAHSQPRVMLGWLSALPEEIVRARPLLSLGYAWMSAINGQLEAVEPLLEPVEAWLSKNQTPTNDDNPSPDGGTTPMAEEEWRVRPEEVDIDVDLLRAYVSRFLGSPRQAVLSSSRALARIPADNLRLQAIAWLCNGHGQLLENNLAEADAALVKAVELGRSSGHIAAYLSAVHYQGQLRKLQGRLHDSLAVYQRALDHISSQTRWRFAGIERIGIGHIYREWNDLPTARRYVEEGLALVEAGGDFVFLRDGYLAAAQLAQALGEHKQALTYVASAEDAVRREHANWDGDLVAAWRARLMLQQGRLDEAVRWSENCGLRIQDGLGNSRATGLLTLARVLLGQGRTQEAECLLDNLLRMADTSGQTASVLQTLVLQSLARQSAGDPVTAFATLRRALALAKPEGYVRLFLDEGQPMAELLLWGMARQEWIGPQLVTYVEHLLSQFGLSAGPAAAPALEATGPAQVSSDSELPIEPLSERELEVLHLVAAGASNQEAAERLFVTVNTVRSHLRNINGKLNTTSRGQAVARARALRMLA
ncbi:MAG: LuxR C-terminal-related transcriptional regulator [Caldilineales bacterium]